MPKKYQRVIDLVWNLERKGLYGEEIFELKKLVEKLQAELNEDIKQIKGECLSEKVKRYEEIIARCRCEECGHELGDSLINGGTEILCKDCNEGQ